MDHDSFTDEGALALPACARTHLGLKCYASQLHDIVNNVKDHHASVIVY